MKTRKVLTAVFLAVFIALTAVCLIFGSQIRDALSKRVLYIFPEYQLVDGQLFLALPTEAIRYDELGGEYVLIAEVSQKYPERCYEAQKKEVRIYKTYGQTALISYGVQTGDRVIVAGDVTDSERVIAEQYTTSKAVSYDAYLGNDCKLQITASNIQIETKETG